MLTNDAASTEDTSELPLDVKSYSKGELSLRCWEASNNAVVNHVSSTLHMGLKIKKKQLEQKKNAFY